MPGEGDGVTIRATSSFDAQGAIGESQIRPDLLRAAGVLAALDKLDWAVRGTQLNLLIPPGPVHLLLMRLRAHATFAGQPLRLRITAPEHLLDLPWEFSTVPTLNGRLVPVTKDTELTLVRETGPRPTRERRDSDVIVVADALGLQGEVRIDDAVTIDLPENTGRAARDAALIGEVLAGTSYEFLPVPAADPKSLRESLAAPAFGFYFGGHHTAEGVVLHSDDRTRAAVFPDLELAERLGAAGVEVAVFAACETATGGDCAPLARRAVEHGVKFAIGMYGPLDHADGERFAEAFFAALATDAPVEDAVAAGRRQIYNKLTQPFVYAAPDEPLSFRRPLPPLPPSDVFRAWWLPPDWASRQDPAPIDDALACRADLLLGIGRQPLTAIVADRAGAGLADELNGLQRAFPQHAENLVRQWYDVNASGSVPTDPDDLASRTDRRESFRDQHKRDPTRVGVVLRYALPARAVWASEAPAADLARNLAAVRRIVRHAGIVLQISAGDPMDALLAAADVAAAATRTGLTDVDVLTRVAPGGSGPAERTLHDVASAVTRARRARGLEPAWPGPAPDDRPVVAALNAGAAPPGGDERRFLLLVRDWAPEGYERLLEAYAVHREGPGFYAALAAAATREQHLERWLSALPADRAVDPGGMRLDWHGPQRTADMLIATAERTGHPRAGEFAVLWKHLAADPCVTEIAEGCVPPGGPRLWEPETVRLWARHRDVSAVEIDVRTPSFWAMISQTPVTRALADRLTALPSALTTLVGLRAGTPHFDATDLDDVERLSLIVRPYRRGKAL
ncbi:CHAT domain-containing protein [Micromonospora sp. NPDC049230]|uniref:CHAT domain-containing protein n=1 Tax=Micromonospora sp. NPDC049230 TaxID=3155502 RepID=UPI0033E14AB9